MNGAADLGGMMGFGPVVPEPEDERFHAEWERRVARARARHGRGPGGGASTRAGSPARACRRRCTSLLLLRDLDAGAGAAAGRHRPRGGGRAGRGAGARARRRRPRLEPRRRQGGVRGGQPVHAARTGPGPVRGRRRRAHPRAAPHRAHPAAPLRPRQGRASVERVHGAHVLPDSNAHGHGERPEWLYTVRFSGRELWGEAADPTLDRGHRRPGRAYLEAAAPHRP